MIEIREITQDVYRALTQCERNVFPLVAPEGTGLPFVVFERSNMYETPTKDGGELEIGFTVRIVTATYFDGLTIVDHIRTEFRHFQSHYGYKPRLTGATEEYTTDGYVQSLTFTF